MEEEEEEAVVGVVLAARGAGVAPQPQEYGGQTCGKGIGGAASIFIPLIELLVLQRKVRIHSMGNIYGELEGSTNHVASTSGSH